MWPKLNPTPQRNQTTDQWLPKSSVRIIEAGNLTLHLRTQEERRRILAAESAFFNGLRFPLQRIIMSEPLNLSTYLGDLRHSASQCVNTDRSAYLERQVSHAEGMIRDRNLVQWRTLLVIPTTAETAEQRLSYVQQGLERIGLDARVCSAGEAETLQERFVPEMARLDFRHTEHFRVGDRYCQILALRDYPRTVRLEHLLGMYRMDRRVTVVQHIHPSGPEIGRHLSNAVGELRSRLDLGLSPERRTKVQMQLEDAEYMLTGLAGGQAQVLDLSTMFLLQCQSEEELETLSRQVQLRLESFGLRARRLHPWQNQDGLRACMPCGNNPLADLARRNVPATSLPAVFPYSHAELNHGRGLFHGINQETGNAVIIDHWSLPNPHMVFLGQSGSGKSFTMGLLLLQQWAQGLQIRSLDIDGDRNKRALWETMGAQRVRIAPGSCQYINPMEVRQRRGDIEDEGEVSDPLQATIQRQLTMFGLMAPDMTPRDLIAAERLLLAVYRAFEEELGRSYTTWATEEWPTWTHLYQYAEQYQQTERLAAALYSWVEGSLTGMFDRCTSVQLDCQAVVFDVSAVAQNPQARGAVLLAVLGYLWDEINAEWSRRKVLELDEFGLLACNDQILQFLWMVAKSARRRSCSLMLATQDPADLLFAENEDVRKYVHGILGNACCKILGSMDARSGQQLAETGYVSTGQAFELTQLPQESKLIMVLRETALIRVVSPMDP